MIRKTLAGILLGANLIFNSCENYEKPQTKTIQETGSPEFVKIDSPKEFLEKKVYVIVRE